LKERRHEFIDNILQRLISPDVEEGTRLVDLNITDGTVLVLLEIFDNTALTNCKK
jgi:hypothetical protein